MGYSSTMEDTAIIDPTGCNTNLPLRRVFYPLGFPVEIVTNSQDLLVAAERSWGLCTQIFFERALELHIGIADADSSEEININQEPVVRSRNSLLNIIAGPHNFLSCDMESGFAYGWLTPSTVRAQPYVRYFFLEAAVMILLAAAYITPLHGACVSRGGKGILLCGDSGAGKSSLSYACARAGWTFTSDDASYLVRNRTDRLVVGNAYQIRFRDNASNLFPELHGENVTPRATGKPSIEFPTPRMPELVVSMTCNIDHVIFLNRTSNEPRGVVSYSRELALQSFEQSVSAARPLREAQLASVRDLLAVDVFEMHYRGLDEAIGYLEELISK